MTTLHFEMESRSYKPEFVSPEYPDLVFLLDTGADTPVWCVGVEEFLDIFAGARKMDYPFILSGFGTGVEVVPAFSIPEFKLSDGDSWITFQNMPVAVTNRPSINADFILSASLFHHMIFP